MKYYTTRETCRICDGELEEVLDLGLIAVSDFISSEDEVNKVPLKLTNCSKCGLVQLQDTVNQDMMYHQYWYQSGFNKTMINWLTDIKEKALECITLEPGDTVIDIGANDGTFLSFFDPTIFRVGFDPAKNLKSFAEPHCSLYINDYFTYSPLIPKAKLITSIAMFYDLEDPNKFVNDVYRSLHEDGIWIIQMMDLLSMWKTNAFDNICHEHLEYYSLHVLKNLLSSHKLQIFKIEHNEVNGGSVRVYICHQDKRVIHKSVFDSFKEEEEYFNSFTDAFAAFRDKVEFIKNTISNFLREEASNGRKIYLMGASTKGNTLLQYFGIDNTLIPYAAEVSKSKFGLKTVVTNIEIIDEKQALIDKPDYFLVLPWTFIDFFVRIHQDYLEQGGQFIVPCPEPYLISKEGVRALG